MIGRKWEVRAAVVISATQVTVSLVLSLVGFAKLTRQRLIPYSLGTGLVSSLGFSGGVGICHSWGKLGLAYVPGVKA